LEKALPAATSDETRSFAKETIETTLTEWSDNGKVAANVRFCLGKDVTKEILPNVAVEKVRALSLLGTLLFIFSFFLRVRTFILQVRGDSRIIFLYQ